MKYTGRVNDTVNYSKCCDVCRATWDLKVSGIKRLGLPNEKAALDSLGTVVKNGSMNVQSWSYLAYHPNYLEWSEKPQNDEHKVPELRT